MRISDWSSDVCSSDLPGNHHFQITACTGHRHDAWLDDDRCGDRAVPDPFQRFVLAALDQSGAVHPFCGGHRPDDFLGQCNPATSHPGRFRHWRAGHTNVGLRHASGKHANAAAMVGRSEEHTSELQSLMRISYAVFCLKKKKKLTTN